MSWSCKAAFGAALILAGCDIPGRLVVKNKSGAAAHVRFYPDQVDHVPFVRRLSAKGDSAQVNFLYGFSAGFVGYGLEEHVCEFRQVDIITSTDSISITEASRFRSLYTDGRRGIAKAVCVWKIR